EVLSSMGEPVTGTSTRPSIYAGPPGDSPSSSRWDLSTDAVPRSDLHATGIHGEASAISYPPRARRRRVGWLVAVPLAAGAIAAAFFALRDRPNRATAEPPPVQAAAPSPMPVAPSPVRPAPAPAVKPVPAPAPSKPVAAATGLLFVDSTPPGA